MKSPNKYTMWSSIRKIRKKNNWRGGEWEKTVRKTDRGGREGGR